jgi:hypothetical protein
MISPRLAPSRVDEKVFPRALSDEEVARLEGYRPAEDWYEYLSHAPESVRGVREDGTLLFVVLRGCLSRGALAKAYSGLRDFRAAPLNRGSAAGRDGAGRTLKSYPAITAADGSTRRSKTNMIPTGTLRNLRIGDSGVVGSLDRDDRYPYCRSARGNGPDSRRLRAVAPLAREVDQVFAYAVPDRWVQQREIASRTRPEWMIADTCFTTITVNRNFTCGTHRDAGDYKPGFSNLVMLRSGDFSGGHLVLPQYRVAIELENGDALFFDPHEWHGTSPIHGLHRRFERITLVMYYRTGMAECGSVSEEITRARAVAKDADLERPRARPRLKVGAPA